MWYLSIFCLILIWIIIVLALRITGIHRALRQIRKEFALRLSQDTNVGIEVGISDPEVRRLGADIDRELKKLRREYLRYSQGDRELKEAITGISHDLRTPLTAIYGYLELLKREEVSGQGREYLRVMENRMESMKDLMEELFLYSLVFSADHYVERERVSLNRVMEECIADYYGILREYGIEPDITMPERNVERNLNPEALSRILGNVMSNALKYSSGDLKIALSGEGEIRFCNRADQLDEISVKRLCDRYYTVENSRKATGLGLAIAKTLIEQMGGMISIEYVEGELQILIMFEERNN